MNVCCVYLSVADACLYLADLHRQQAAAVAAAANAVDHHLARLR
jgi:hypothetical protein